VELSRKNFFDQNMRLNMIKYLTQFSKLEYKNIKFVDSRSMKPVSIMEKLFTEDYDKIMSQINYNFAKTKVDHDLKVFLYENLQMFENFIDGKSRFPSINQR
jgi:hypothetical protein